MTQNVAAERLKYTTPAPKDIDHGELTFIAVLAPPELDRSGDLKFTKKAVSEITPAIKEYKGIVGRSAMPVKAGVKR